MSAAGGAMPKATAMPFSFNNAPEKKAPNTPPPAVRKSLRKTVAWMNVRAAFRHLPSLWNQDAAVIVGVVVPEDDVTAYSDVLGTILHSDSASSDVLSEDGKWTLEVQLAAAIRSGTTARLGLVVSDRAKIPPHFAAVANAIVDVPPRCTKRLAGAVWHLVGKHAADADTDCLAAHDTDVVSALLRTTRCPARAAAALRKLAADAPPPAARPSGPRLEDLHGYGEAQAWGLDLARDLADWRSGTLPWADVDRGVLLSGPPGTGKTTFAAALARTCGAHFIAGSYAAWQSAGHLGDFQRALRKAFADARKHAPTILLIDEIDAIGSRASGDSHDREYSNKVIASFLEVLDGAEGREGVVVVGCANHPDDLDPALRRPGRLDRHIVIPVPDGKARLGILRHHLSGALAGEDLSAVVDLTEDWTGAALEKLVRDARRLARRHRRDMTVGDMLECLPSRVPVPEEARWRIAVHEAGHAVVGLETAGDEIVSVEVARMRTAGDERLRASVTWRADEDALLIAPAGSYLDRIATVLGGMAAERVVFGDASDGSGGPEESDLAKATRLAAALEGSLGLGGTLTHLATLDQAHLLATKDFTIRKSVEATLQECLKRAEAIVTERREDVLAVARAVMEREKLTGEEVREIVTRQPRLRLVPGG